MKACPNCGAPLGAGALDGLCPRCLVAGTAESTEPAVALRGVRLAAVGGEAGRGHTPLVSDGPSAGAAAASTSPSVDGAADLGLGDPDEAVIAARDAVAPGRQTETWAAKTASPRPRIEGYDILREVTHGGQGVVYLAVQRSTKRKVAIKVLLAGRYASRSARHRFEREIELVASLKHPNIIAVFDSGTTEEGYEYYVMDYVRGVPATAFARNKRLTLEEALTLFATVCDAVNHAHQRGVIHRDLKPSNVLVDVDGNVRVLDFGLAKAMTDPVESQASVTGNVVGTLPYMSPEQTRGNPDEIDTRTDVYALGVMLFEMLTGRHPYPTTGGMADVVRHINESPPSRPSRCWTGDSGVRGRPHRRTFRRRQDRCPLDFDVETIVLKALAKDREQRYDSAGQFARDIRRYLHGEQIVARRPSTWYQLRVFSRRNKGLVAAVSAALFVLAAGVVATSIGLKTVHEARVRADEAAVRMGAALASAGDEFAEAGDLVAARRLYHTRLDEASEWGVASATLLGLLEITSRPGGATPLLGRYGPAGGTGGFHGHTMRPTSVVVLPASRTALTSGDDGQLIRWDLLTGRAIDRANVTAKEKRSRSLAYVTASPDQTTAVTAGFDGTVRRWTVEPLRQIGPVLDPSVPDVWNPEVWVVAISRDNRRILAGTNDGHIIMWSEADGWSRARQIGDKQPESVPALAFVPDPHGGGRFALSADHKGHIRLWDLDANRIVWEVPEAERQHRGQVNCLVISDDGATAATGSFDGKVGLWKVEGTGQDTRLRPDYAMEASDSAYRVWRVALSSGGKYVAAALEDGTAAVWKVKGADEVGRFVGQSGRTMGVGFVGPDCLVSAGDDTTDAKGRTSALKVWQFGDKVLTLPGITGAAAPSVSVNDDGDVEVRSGTQAVKLYIGNDGGLHEGVPSSDGPTARTKSPRALSGAAQAPSWAEGGSADAASRRSAAATGGAPPIPLATLSDGKAKLAAGPRNTLALWGVPKDGAAGPGGADVLVRQFWGHRGAVTAVGVSPAERFVVSVDNRAGVKVWDLFRPARAHELERKAADALEHLEKEPDSPTGLAALRDWYAFHGRDVAVAELLERARAWPTTTATAR